MKDIFSKIVQGLNSRATDVLARQDALASANEEPGIKTEAERASPPEFSSASAQGPSTRKSFAFMEAAKERQDASPRNPDVTENASRPHAGDRRPHQDPADARHPLRHSIRSVSLGGLTIGALDPVSRIPEFKVCAVQIEKIVAPMETSLEPITTSYLN